jgi:hypothetical protein
MLMDTNALKTRVNKSGNVFYTIIPRLKLILHTISSQ